jgi:hypothetical protein
MLKFNPPEMVLEDVWREDARMLFEQDVNCTS